MRDLECPLDLHEELICHLWLELGQKQEVVEKRLEESDGLWCWH